MIIDLIATKIFPYDFSASLAPEEIDLSGEDVKLKSNVALEGKVIKKIMQANVEGALNAGIEIECSRCLQPIDRKLDFSFEAAFVTEENYTESKEAELKETDLDVSIFDGAKIDVNELVREQILLNLPAQEFCSENCRGLCPKCGVNRNLINCNCEEKEVDPRWSALKNLK